MKAAGAEAFLPVTNEFLDSILRLNLRVAAFDCDGTLWSGDVGESFFDWELREGIVAKPLVHRLRERYAAYRRGEVGESTMCGEMVTMHQGISERKMMLLRPVFRGADLSRHERTRPPPSGKWLRGLGGVGLE
jgi:hypothetical protein